WHIERCYWLICRTTFAPAARQAPVDKRIGYVDGTVAVRNGQRAAGAKVATSNSARCAIRPP
ncbi:hypothetical protein, partial [Acinetobacter baumannii]|uniref:hypothetical protein n=1 Tax=Acinetobacter baumannii TaxID=470 RepID=UPI00197AFF90